MRPSTIEKAEKIIQTLKRDPELTANQLAERFGLSSSKILDLLRKRGLKPAEAKDGFSS